MVKNDASDFGSQGSDSDREETRQLTVTMPKEHWARLDRLAKAHPFVESTEALISELLDHVQQGVYRSGAWERGWLLQAIPYDAVEDAYRVHEDPLYRHHLGREVT